MISHYCTVHTYIAYVETLPTTPPDRIIVRRSHVTSAEFSSFPEHGRSTNGINNIYISVICTYRHRVMPSHYVRPRSRCKYHIQKTKEKITVRRLYTHTRIHTSMCIQCYNIYTHTHQGIYERWYATTWPQNIITNNSAVRPCSIYLLSRAMCFIQTLTRHRIPTYTHIHTCTHTHTHTHIHSLTHSHTTHIHTRAHRVRTRAYVCVCIRIASFNNF